MKNNPIISVVMSVYNGQKYLTEAINSILHQKYADFEFIIINDGSNDQTNKILESYTDSRMRLYNQENAGLTRSLNRGFSLAKGDFIARQDADDVSLPDRFEKQIKYLMEKKEVALVGSACEKINGDGTFLELVRYPTKNDELKNVILQYNPFWHPSIMLRKKCIEDVGCYREIFKFAQDYDLWLRISEKYKIGNLNDVLVKYRFELNSITVKKLEEQLLFRDIAIKLAKERKEKGNDDELHMYIEENYEKVMQLKKIQNEEEIRSIMKGWITLLSAKGKRYDAFKISLKLIKRNPYSINNYKDILKLITKSF